MVEFTRRKLLASSVTTAVGSSVIGATAAGSAGPDENPSTPSVDGSIKRFATTALGAEVTGPFVFETGELLYSLQHPSRDNPAPYNRAAVGVIEGFQFDFSGSNEDFEALSPPTTASAQGKIRSAGGQYNILVQQGDTINGGTETWGHPETPDGTDLADIVGESYSAVGYNPDMNFFVPENEAGTEGYLFTNNEQTPGAISRTPIARTNGSWEADLDNALELENRPAFRDIGGTKINCYGDLSPWSTPLSAEEEYGHPRVSGLATVSDIVEQGTGVGLRGGSEFWNRPNLTEVEDSLQDLFDDDAWYPMGLGANAGTEQLAYYLGAEPIDRTEAGNERTPIDDVFPNRYRYGYIVEIADPTAEEPTPVKHHVFGRAAFECPEVLPDKKTVYLASDGGAKCVYKFVAEKPIPSYDSRMDVRGTLHAMRVTKGGDGPVAETPLEIEWLELGTASNAEIESWIAEYDDITQVDYLETHAETDWQDDLEQALREADETVAIEGNQDYITDEEVVEWARQYEQRGPDAVDEDLRRVPFLETRAAAKEIGASVECNKAEGIDSHDDAQPGDFVYFGISSLSGYMTDDAGDLRFDEVDTGVVYRGELEADYNVSRLEPAIVGPNASDPQSVKDVSLINVDNIMVMDDHRVLLCEDKGSFGRSYPNDALHVYQPPVFVGVDSVAISHSSTGTVELIASTLPDGFAGARVSVSVSHPDVAEITEASYNDALGLTQSPAISDDGSTVELKAADTDNTLQAGASNVTIATLEIEGVDTGTADLTVDVHEMDDDDGAQINVSTRSGLAITGPPSIGGGGGGGVGGAPPTDPGGDGLYEDVNGNGRLDYDDVVTLFEYIEDDSAQLNEAAYDFNQNGRLDYDDIVDLYEEI